MSDVVRRLRSYHMQTDEGDEEVLAPVAPLPKSQYRMVPLSRQEAEALEYLGRGLCKLGADRTGLLLMRLAASWEAAAE